MKNANASSPAKTALNANTSPVSAPKRRAGRVAIDAKDATRPSIAGNAATPKGKNKSKDNPLAGQDATRAAKPDANTRGGRPLDTNYLYRILTNPIYIGKIAHTRMVDGESQTDVFDGIHEPVIERSLWERVQGVMAKAARETQHRWTHTHLLKGKLRTSEDYAMSPASVQRIVRRDGKPTKERRLVRYYVSQKAIKLGYATCPIKTINATRLDELVRALVCDHAANQWRVDLASQPPEIRDHRVRELLSGVVLAPDRIHVTVRDDRLAACREATDGVNERKATTLSPSCPITPEVESVAEGTRLTLRLQIKRLDGKRLLLSEGGEVLSPLAQAATSEHVRYAIGRAFAWHDELIRTGMSIRKLADKVGLTDSRVDHILLLNRLAPSILKLALQGKLPPHIGLKDLTHAARHLDWGIQAKQLQVGTT